MQQAKKAATKVAKPGIKAALGSAVVGAAKSTFDIVGPGKKFKVLKKVAGLAGGMKAVKIAKASAAAKPGTKVLAANAARKAANITKAEKAAKAGKMGKVKKVGLAAAGFYALDKIPLGGGSKKPASTIGPSTKRPEGMYPKGGGKGLKFGPNVSINAGGSTTSYTVKKGDNLSKIAKEQGTTLAEIRKLNPIFTDKKNKYKGGNLIFSGTKVKLPTKK
jgi:LysM repeat protein